MATYSLISQDSELDEMDNHGVVTDHTSLTDFTQSAADDIGQSAADDIGLADPDKPLLNETRSNHMTKRQTWKNMLVLSTVFVMLFMAFNGLVDLQSSLFIADGLGVITQSVVYGSYAVSCLTTPKYLISKIGHKWCITLSICGYVSWMAANGYATWITMTTTSFLVGLSAAPLWVAQNAYLTALAQSYAKLHKKKFEPTLTLFFGIFTALFKISSFCGNTISWLILRSENVDTGNHTQSPDVSSSGDHGDMTVCGAEDCPWRNTSNSHYKPVPKPILYTLVGTYLLLGVLALLLAIFGLDQLPEYKVQTKKTETIKSSIVAVLRRHKDVRQLLLIPMGIFSSMEMIFIWADFNKSYVTCAIGIWMVGLVFLPSVTLEGLGSLSVGFLAKYLNRLYIFIFVAMVDTTLLLCLYFWHPTADGLFMFFFVPGMIGLAGGVFQVQLKSVLGFTFEDPEAAFACFHLWGSMAASAAFGMNRFLCVKYKILINSVCLIVWFICYLFFEKISKRYNNKSIKT